MRACKCDKCGALYDAPNCVPNITVRKYEHPYGERIYDLCPPRSRKLEQWLKEDK